MTVEETTKSVTFGAAALAVAMSAFPPQQQVPLPVYFGQPVPKIGDYVLMPTRVPGAGYSIESVTEQQPFHFDQPTLIAIFKKAESERREARKHEVQETVAERFHRLAAEWSQEVQNVSSLTAMVAHPKYRQIVDLKWDAVPFILTDLQRNKRFWLPALYEITGIQPFDPSDAGNSKRYIE
jgi:hypothetical protein